MDNENIATIINAKISAVTEISQTLEENIMNEEITTLDQVQMFLTTWCRALRSISA